MSKTISIIDKIYLADKYYLKYNEDELGKDDYDDEEPDVKIDLKAYAIWRDAVVNYCGMFGQDYSTMWLNRVTERELMEEFKFVSTLKNDQHTDLEYKEKENTHTDGKSLKYQGKNFSVAEINAFLLRVEKRAEYNLQRYINQRNKIKYQKLYNLEKFSRKYTTELLTRIKFNLTSKNAYLTQDFPFLHMINSLEPLKRCIDLNDVPLDILEIIWRNREARGGMKFNRQGIPDNRRKLLLRVFHKMYEYLEFCNIPVNSIDWGEDEEEMEDPSQLIKVEVTQLNGPHGEYTADDDLNDFPFLVDDPSQLIKVEVTQLNGSHGEYTADDDLNDLVQEYSSEEIDRLTREARNLLNYIDIVKSWDEDDLVYINNIPYVRDLALFIFELTFHNMCMKISDLFSQLNGINGEHTGTDDLSQINFHLIKSQLNGMQGEATSTDDYPTITYNYINKYHVEAIFKLYGLPIKFRPPNRYLGGGDKKKYNKLRELEANYGDILEVARDGDCFYHCMALVLDINHVNLRIYVNCQLPRNQRKSENADENDINELVRQYKHLSLFVHEISRNGHHTIHRFGRGPVDINLYLSDSHYQLFADFNLMPNLRQKVDSQNEAFIDDCCMSHQSDHISTEIAPHFKVGATKNKQLWSEDVCTSNNNIQYIKGELDDTYDAFFPKLAGTSNHPTILKRAQSIEFPKLEDVLSENLKDISLGSINDPKEEDNSFSLCSSTKENIILTRSSLKTTNRYKAARQNFCKENNLSTLDSMMQLYEKNKREIHNLEEEDDSLAERDIPESKADAFNCGVPSSCQLDFTELMDSMDEAVAQINIDKFTPQEVIELNKSHALISGFSAPPDDMEAYSKFMFAIYKTCSKYGYKVDDEGENMLSQGSNEVEDRLEDIPLDKGPPYKMRFKESPNEVVDKQLHNVLLYKKDPYWHYVLKYFSSTTVQEPYKYFNVDTNASQRGMKIVKQFRAPLFPFPGLSRINTWLHYDCFFIRSGYKRSRFVTIHEELLYFLLSNRRGIVLKPSEGESNLAYIANFAHNCEVYRKLSKMCGGPFLFLITENTAKVAYQMLAALQNADRDIIV